MSSDDHNPLHGPRGKIDATETTRDQVAAWRRMRMSWADIARNLGRPEPDVRAMFDATWKGGA